MAKTAEEKAAAKAAKDAEKAAKVGDSATETIGDIEVGNPLVLRPVELPLVIKPADGGEWANEAQAEYAKYLNAYAYKNPTKWQVKKATLIAKLANLAKKPQDLAVYQGGGQGNLSYNNKLIS